jgi:hypothetical protein
LGSAVVYRRLDEAVEAIIESAVTWLYVVGVS